MQNEIVKKIKALIPETGLNKKKKWSLETKKKILTLVVNNIPNIFSTLADASEQIGSVSGMSGCAMSKWLTDDCPEIREIAVSKGILAPLRVVRKASVAAVLSRLPKEINIELKKLESRERQLESELKQVKADKKMIVEVQQVLHKN